MIHCHAPNKRKELFVLQPDALNRYTRVLKAILDIESGGDTFAYNPAESAYGALQIRPIRVRDYNMRTGKNYTTEDMFDLKKATEVFVYYAERLESEEEMARQWNGGPRGMQKHSTEDYWNQVKTLL